MEYIDRNEFEETILRQNRHDDLMASFGIIIEKRKAASVGLNE